MKLRKNAWDSRFEFECKSKFHISFIVSREFFSSSLLLNKILYVRKYTLNEEFHNENLIFSSEFFRLNLTIHNTYHMDDNNMCTWKVCWFNPLLSNSDNYFQCRCDVVVVVVVMFIHSFSLLMCLFLPIVTFSHEQISTFILCSSQLLSNEIEARSDFEETTKISSLTFIKQKNTEASKASKF